MATAPEPSATVGSTSSWALPLAATILVAGSLAFWTAVGALWLASWPVAQAPVVISGAAAATERPDVTSEHGAWGRAEGEPPVRMPSVGSLRLTTATQTASKLVQPTAEEHDDATR